MSAPICPYCGDGMESIGTLNHIECATKLLAEVEHQTKARKRHAKLERDAVLAYGKMSKRAEAAEAKVLQLGIEKDAEEYRANVAEAEVEQLTWMLDEACRLRALIWRSEMDRTGLSEQFPKGTEDGDEAAYWLADLAARYDFWHEGGDG